VGQEELAQGGGGQATLDVRVVEIGASQISKLPGGIFVLVASEGWSLRGTKFVLAMLDQKVERFDAIGEGQRSLLFEVFMSHIEQIRNVDIAESGTGWV
jgi:hypothetical protein